MWQCRYARKNSILVRFKFDLTYSPTCIYLSLRCPPHLLSHRFALLSTVGHCVIFFISLIEHFRRIQLSQGRVLSATFTGLPHGTVVFTDNSHCRNLMGIFLAGRWRHSRPGDPGRHDATHHIIEGKNVAHWWPTDDHEVFLQIYPPRGHFILRRHGHDLARPWHFGQRTQGLQVLLKDSCLCEDYMNLY